MRKILLLAAFLLAAVAIGLLRLPLGLVLLVLGGAACAWAWRRLR